MDEFQSYSLYDTLIQIRRVTPRTIYNQFIEEAVGPDPEMSFVQIIRFLRFIESIQEERRFNNPGLPNLSE